MHLVTFLVLLLAHSQAAKPAPDGSPSLKPVQGTAGIELNDSFQLSMSPDDRWIVFFEQSDPNKPESPEEAWQYGRLRVIDLSTGERHSFTLRDEQAPDHSMIEAEAAWAADSSLCVLPKPPAQDRRVLVLVNANKAPRVEFIRLPDPHKPPRPREPTPGELVKLPETFTCSDCPGRDDSDLFRKHIPKELLFVGNFKSLTEHSRQCASFDGTKVYYQEGPQGKAGTTTPWAEVTLYEVDVATGTKRVVARHNADCPMIDQLRPSPDGTKLAYQLTTGCGFIATPDVIVLDLATGKAEDIALGSGAMRWSSTSDKLYFNRDFLNEPDDGHLWVAEFSKEKLTPAAPSVPATTQPAK